MPKITGYISSEGPNVGTGTPRAQYKDDHDVLRLLGVVSPDGRNLDEAGKSMANMGLKFLEREKNNRQILESADAQIRGISELGNLYKSTLLDKAGYDTAADRFDAGSKEVVDRIVNSTLDPQVRANLTKTLGMYRVQHQIDLNGHIIEYRAKENQARLMSTVESLVDKSGNTELGGNEFSQIISTGTSLIKSYGISIGMNPVEVGKLDKQFRAGVSKTQALRIMNLGDDGPQKAIDMITSGELPHLDPGTREVLINTATRRIQAINSRRDADVRRSIAIEDRNEKTVDRLEAKRQEQNYGTLDALIRRRTDSEGNPVGTDAIRELINRSVRERDISPEHVAKLEGRLRQDYREDVSWFNKKVDENFSTKGKFESLDGDNEKYKSRLKLEGEEEIRKGRRPQEIYMEIEDREKRRTPLTPNAYPTPQLLSGDKESIADLQRAAEKTAMAIEAYNDVLKKGGTKAQALQAGMDPKVGARELRNLKELMNAVNYQNKLKAERDSSPGRK